MADRERDSDFSIVIATFGASYTVDLQFADREDGGEGQMCDLPPAMDDLRPLLTGAAGRGWRQGSQPVGTADIAYLAPDLTVVQEVGKRLFGTVLQGEGAGAFRARLVSALESPQGHMRVRIDATKNDPTLFRIPWEALYDPKEGRWLGTDVATPLHRVLRSNKTSKRPARVKAPLKVLVVVANPENDLDAEAELANLDARVKVVEQASKENVLLVLPPIRRATRSELYRRILDDRPNIIHYIGHGSFRDGVGYIHLHDKTDEAKAEHLSATDFSELLSNDLPNLVILNTCQGGTASDFDPFGGTAQSLIRQGVPAVVAMQFQISDKAAITFSEALYRSLLNKDPIDIAVTRARHAILTGDPDIQPEMITPVLYCASQSDGLLIRDDLAASAGPSLAPAPSSGRAKRGMAPPLVAVGILAGLMVGYLFTQDQASPVRSLAPPSDLVRHSPSVILGPSPAGERAVDAQPASPLEGRPAGRRDAVAAGTLPPASVSAQSGPPSQPLGADPLDWSTFERARWEADVARITAARQRYETDLTAALAAQAEYERALADYQAGLQAHQAGPSWRERLGYICTSLGFCRRYPADSGAGETLSPPGGDRYNPGPVSGGSLGAAAPGSEQDFVVNAGDRIYFDFDSVTVRPDAFPRLDAQAAWLMRYPRTTIRIEGHTDGRGSREHNLVVGARRAEAVRNYLIERGVAESRIDTISYGKERPIALGSNEEAEARNRNARTVIVSGYSETPTGTGRPIRSVAARPISIGFEPGTALLRPESSASLATASAAFGLPGNLDLSALVIGFSDADTRDSEVGPMATARAQAVVDGLASAGLSLDRTVIEASRSPGLDPDGTAVGATIWPVITGAHALLFEDGRLRPEELRKVDLAADWLTRHPEAGLNIHVAEPTGEETFASGQRAQTIIDALEARGIPSDRLSPGSLGELGLGPEADAASQNRAVLIVRPHFSD